MRLPGWLKNTLVVFAVTACFSLLQTIVEKIDGTF